MDFSTLTTEELNTLFMKVNTEYLRLCKGDPKEYMMKAKFLQMGNELTAVINELVRRRALNNKSSRLKE